MDFDFTPEQTMLRDTVASFLANCYDFSTRRTIAQSKAGWRPEYWRDFAVRLGILGASIPESYGGLGGGAVENMIVMEEFGAALVIEPFLDTVVIGGSLLRHADPVRADELIPRLVAGEVVTAFAYAEPQARYNWADLKTSARKHGSGYVLDGHKSVVVGAPWATHLLVTARTSGGQRDRQGISLFLVERRAPGISTRDYPTIDGLRASDVYFNGVLLGGAALIGEVGAALPLIEAVIDDATAAVCAEAVGVMRRLLADTIDYARQRRQFGRTIAEFQVLQHRMVDMSIKLEQAESMSYLATLKLAASPEERAPAVSAAKVQISQACRFIGQNAIQIHGGMGLTDDLAVSHYFKRATVIESLFGSVDHHLRRVAASA